LRLETLITHLVRAYCGLGLEAPIDRVRSGRLECLLRGRLDSLQELLLLGIQGSYAIVHQLREGIPRRHLEAAVVVLKALLLLLLLLLLHTVDSIMEYIILSLLRHNTILLHLTSVRRLPGTLNPVWLIVMIQRPTRGVLRNESIGEALINLILSLVVSMEISVLDSLGEVFFLVHLFVLDGFFGNLETASGPGEVHFGSSIRRLHTCLDTSITAPRCGNKRSENGVSTP
jgi:hypothetical protein